MDKLSENFQTKIREAKFFRFKLFVFTKLIIVLKNLCPLGQSFKFALIQILQGNAGHSMKKIKVQSSSFVLFRIYN